MKITMNAAGLSLGFLFAMWHAGWSALVAAGWAKPVLDFVLSLHFLSFSYTVEPFSFAKAAGLVVLTFAVGYVMGWVLAAIWNRFVGRTTS